MADVRYWVDRIDASAWRIASERTSAHMFCFGKELAPDPRSSFALVIVRNSRPCGFVECGERDGHLDWLTGAVFPHAQKTPVAFMAMVSALDWALRDYESVTMNVPIAHRPLVRQNNDIIK